MKKFIKILMLMLFVGIGATSCDIAEILGGETNGAQHEHKFSKLEKDETYHWYSCSISGCNEINQKEEHDWETIVEAEATEEQDGLTTHTCKFCRYYKEEVTHYEAPPHTHDQTQLKTDANKHWYICSCGEIWGRANHTYPSEADATVIKAAVFGTKGVKRYTCSVCQYYTDKAYDLPQSEYDAEATSIKTAIGNLTGANNEATTAANLYIRYSKLNATAKALVTNYSTLANYVEGYETSYKDSVSNIINLIDSLGYVNEAQTATTLTELDTIFSTLDSFYLEYISNYEVYTACKDLYTTYNALDLTSLSVKKQALVNAAVNYYYQGTQIQYEQRYSRRNVCVSPEDCNAYNWTFQDCSSFCNSVYAYVFGRNIISGKSAAQIDTAACMSYAAANSGTDEVVYYSASETKSQSRATEISNMLQVGDLYVYRHGSAGHIMLYIGNYNGQKCFAHCTGAAGAVTQPYPDLDNYKTEYQTTQEKNYGAIAIDPISDVFSLNGDRYIFDSENDHWCILRPMSRSAVNTLTSSAVSKLLAPNISSEKSVDVGNYHSVTKNTELTYSIKIDNKGSTAQKYVYIKETIPENATFVSCTGDGIYNATNKTIVWHIPSLAAKGTTTITYKLKASGEVGSSILDTNTYIDGTRLGSIANEIKANITTSTLVTAVKALKDTASTSAISNILSAYNTAYSVDFTTGTSDVFPTTDSAIKSKVFNSEYNALNETNDLAKLVPNIMYGGYSYRSYNTDLDSIRNNLNNNMRNVLPSYLEVGDIINVYTKLSSSSIVNTTYIYLGENCIYGLSDGSFTEIYNTTTDVTEFLHTLPWYYLYAVIRPSLSSRLA